NADYRSYFLIWYTRSPASFLVDSIWSPRSFPAVERNPRTLCACQSVAFMISVRVAPLGRPIKSRIFAPLLPPRGELASLTGFARLLTALASCLGACFLEPFMVPWPLDEPFFELASFFEAALSGATGAPCSATAVEVSGVLASAFTFVMVSPF